MNVVEIELINVTTHDHSKLVLPKAGIVVITGENGAGKSTFIEGVSWAGWGKTLRGTVPWRGDADPPCKVKLSTDVLTVTRTRKGSKTALDFKRSEYPSADYVEGGGDVSFDTPTKAQEALANLMGPFDLWRRSHVFSSSDAAHFTMATDAERKKLIESFLGNDRFDPALKACRADLKTAETKLVDLKRQQEVTATTLKAARTRLLETKKQLAACQPPEGAAVDEKAGKSLKEYDAQINDATRELNDMRGKLRKLDAAGAGWDALARQARDALARLAADKCPTCTQPIPQQLRSKLQLDETAAKGKAAIEKKQADDERAALESTFEEISDEVTALQKKRAARAQELAGAQAARAEQERYEKTRALLTRTLQEAGDIVSTSTAALVQIEEDMDVVQADVDELEAVEAVLGVKGVRAHILGKSLTGIEAIANVWLAKLHHADMRVQLRPYSEFKSKEGVDDSISFEVHGAGGGLGYKAASGGERRRLDVAMLLAMAEVASAARGQQAGTLWFDEVYDCLDEQGVDAVVAALRDLARTRAVVVITHSKTLLERLPDARRLSVAHGHVVELG